MALPDEENNNHLIAPMFVIYYGLSMLSPIVSETEVACSLFSSFSWNVRFKKLKSKCIELKLENNIKTSPFLGLDAAFSFNVIYVFGSNKKFGKQNAIEIRSLRLFPGPRYKRLM